MRKSFELLDEETSKPAGYLGLEVPDGRAAAIKQSIEILRQAVAKYPERLDIRVGISQLHAMNEDYEGLLKNYEEILRYAASKDFKGLMVSKGRPAPDPKESLSNDMHHYYAEYSRRTENPDDKLAFRFAETATKYFPKDVRAWNNLCAEYAQQNNYPKAIESLMKAHELDKKDPIVLMNLAHLFVSSKKPKEAIVYYQKVVDLKDPDFSEEAESEIEKLKKMK